MALDGQGNQAVEQLPVRDAARLPELGIHVMRVKPGIVLISFSQTALPSKKRSTPGHAGAIERPKGGQDSPDTLGLFRCQGGRDA